MTQPIRLGAQGWNYDDWVGPFFPAGTRAADYLTTYARAFNAVEVDSTFYAIPSAKTLQAWSDRVPQDFTFAPKLPQEITHENRLRQSDDLLALFSDRVRVLGPKLGPILIQMGPDFAPAELPALAGFLPSLPRDLDFAIEFRQRGWIHDGLLALLAEYRVALTLTDARWIPRKTMIALASRPTADFAYIRWMGADRKLVDYSRIQVDRSRELTLWSDVLPGLASRVRVVHGFVNNHFAGHAPASLRELQGLLGLPAVSPADLGEQISLF